MNYNDPHVLDAIASKLAQNSDIVARFDLDGDGILDSLEFGVLRRVIRGEAKERGDFNIRALPNNTINERYRLLGHLGKGGQGRTVAAHDLQNDTLVVIKLLDMGRLSSWKNLELFEREAHTLQTLDHASIPRYVDAFSIGDPPESFCIVQEYIHGEPVIDIVQRAHLEEYEVRDMLLQLIDIIEYIHSRNPQVVHRDIKPSNLIWEADTATLHLIDFGAVRVRVGLGDGGSTVVGTHGYMPMEQYMGKTSPATDFYAMGATALYLLSGFPPSDLPFERGRIQFHDIVAKHSEFVPILDRLLEPIAERRLSSAEEVRDRLHRLNLDDLPEERPSWMSVKKGRDGDILYELRGTSDIQIADRVNSFVVESGPRFRYYAWVVSISTIMTALFFALDAPMVALFSLIGGIVMCMIEKSEDHLLIDDRGIHLSGYPEPIQTIQCHGAVVSEDRRVVLEFSSGAERTLMIPVQNDQQAFYVCDLINRKLKRFSST